MPFFFVSLGLTQYNLRYVTPVRLFWILFFLLFLLFGQGKGKSAKEVLKRIDYGGSFTLLMAVSLMHCAIMSFS
jgi:hypothetical protein